MLIASYNIKWFSFINFYLYSDGVWISMDSLLARGMISKEKEAFQEIVIANHQFLATTLGSWLQSPILGRVLKLPERSAHIARWLPGLLVSSGSLANTTILCPSYPS